MMVRDLIVDSKDFFAGWGRFLGRHFLVFARGLEKQKSAAAERLYQGRGRLVRPFVHSGMGGLAILGVALAPILADSFPTFSGSSFAQTPPPSAVLSAATEGELGLSTNISEKLRAEVMEYTVASGDSVSGIAQKFGVSVDTIRWANNLASISAIKPGQALKIPPVTGVIHRVNKGDTVYSIAKYYNTEAQGIVDYPFNTFTNDETFQLAVGQTLIVPDGVIPKVDLWAPSPYIARRTPDAGTVVASGAFVWPVSGRLSQGYRLYHRGVDIANKAGTPVLAADAGTVVIAGWPDNIGYGNRILLDHGNGMATLYAHLSTIAVQAGQTVGRGDVIGQVGSTGRSTGAHLHFEIRVNGQAQDPTGYLR